MSFATLPELRCYYRLEGPRDGPVLVLAHALGLDHGMWDPQVPDFAATHLVARYDIRGHGATDVPPGDYTIEQLGLDALALIDALGFERVAWCGASLGGTIGLWLAAHAPNRISHLVVANSTPRIASPAAMEDRRTTVLESGLPAVADSVLARFFTPALLARNPPRVSSARETLLSTDPAGYAGCCAALRDADLSARLGRIQASTLVISGDLDASLPWDAHGAVLVRSIADAAAIRLPTAHLASLGLPRTFARAVLQFLSAPDDPWTAGLALRRAKVGDEHVERALAAGELTHAFQELITRYVWGTVWARPGLDHRSRRMLVLALTAALARWEEFRLHLTAGLDRDLEWSDVEEVLLQTAIYAGVPAANTGFRIAADEQAKRT